MQVSTKEQLVKKTSEEFKLQYGTTPDTVTLTPGRINIIGEHTDYNDGLSMPAAIDRWMCVALSKSNKKASTIYSINYKKCVTMSTNKSNATQGSWIKLASTSIDVLTDEFDLQEGGNVAIGGNIPIGCGLSSSSAFIIAITHTFCQLFSIQIKNRDLAYLCQKIESITLGINCGLLDQYGIILSKKNHFMVIDFHDDHIEYIPVHINECSWLVVNSQIHRELSDTAFIQRMNECQEGLDILKDKFNINGFRDIEETMLLELQAEHEVIYKRLSHLIEENKRVNDMKDQIQKGSADNVGMLLKQSHESLKSLYQVSCKEIDYIIALSENFDGWYGGRIVGGGFGGCSIHLLTSHVVDEYNSYITTNYLKKFDLIPDIIKVSFPGGL